MKVAVILAGTPSGATLPRFDQPADTFLYENVVKMFARMWAPSMGNAIWYINQDVYPQIWTMALAVGQQKLSGSKPVDGTESRPRRRDVGTGEVDIERFPVGFGLNHP